MTAHEYLKSVIAKYSLTESEAAEAEIIRGTVENVLIRSYGPKIDRSMTMVQYHKMTAGEAFFDIEIVVHFENDSFGTAKGMYDSVFNLMSRFYDTVKHRFSTCVSIGENRIHILPVRIIDKATMAGEIYDRCRSCPLRTNVFRQREYVRWSMHRDAVSLMRIWKYCNDVDFGTFPLELITIQVLSDESSDRLDVQMTKVLEFLRYHINDLVLKDPGNVENDVSGSLSSTDRKIVNIEACFSLSKTRWMDIVW